MSDRPEPQPGGEPADRFAGNHFSCVLSAVLLARVRDFGGDAAVAEVLRRSGTRRSAAELGDLTNWISYAEAEALWAAGRAVTHHPAFGRAVGADSVRRLASSPVATMLRSLGAPEKVFEAIGATGRKYSAVTEMVPIACAPGHAHLEGRPLPGFPRSAAFCEWTIGLLGCLLELFGLPPAEVQHTVCAAHGAPACEYHVRWPIGAAAPQAAPAQVAALETQLTAVQDRLRGVFRTAADLVGSGSIDEVLARIARRAALEVRAPRHLIAVQIGPEHELRVHQEGFPAAEAASLADGLRAGETVALDRPGRLVVPVRSTRREYGVLVAAYAGPGTFLPGERELLEVYADCAASALDGTSALMEAEARAGQSSALLGLARSLAAAGTVGEVAGRLCDAVPVVVDCDAVTVFLRDGDDLLRAAGNERRRPASESEARWAGDASSTLRRLLDDPRPDPIFLDLASSDEEQAEFLLRTATAAVALVPLVSGGGLLGLLALSVAERPERLRSGRDLRDRLSGIAAQAATALENARLMDLITHQATHDQLTGLANRTRFAAALDGAVDRARAGFPVAVFYVDLDGFKPINDRHGHDVGDGVLVGVAERLAGCLRPGDLVARLGGDEFAVIAAAADAPQARAVAERISACFDAPFAVGGRRLALTASVGWSLHTGDGPGELLRRADVAMLDAKRLRGDGREPELSVLQA